jgi:hypothetical protein
MTQRITTPFATIIAIVITFSCNNAPTTTTTQKDSTVAATTKPTTTTIDVDTTYKMDIAKNTDSVVVNNSAYIVTSKPNDGDPGELIAVYNKATKQSFAITGDDNFVAMQNNFLLTEAGTAANHRTFSVYNVNTLKMVFSSAYETDLNIENNIVSFKTAVTLTNAALKPTCSPQQHIPADNLGYIEQQYFNLTTNTLQKTGKYACWYFE